MAKSRHEVNDRTEQADKGCGLLDTSHPQRAGFHPTMNKLIRRLAVRKLILLSILLLPGCLHVMKLKPESLQEHCAALAQVKVDRQMMTSQGVPVGGYNRLEAVRKAEKECLMKQEQRQSTNSPPPIF